MVHVALSQITFIELRYISSIPSLSETFKSKAYFFTHSLNILYNVFWSYPLPTSSPNSSQIQAPPPISSFVSSSLIDYQIQFFLAIYW